MGVSGGDLNTFQKYPAGAFVQKCQWSVKRIGSQYLRKVLEFLNENIPAGIYVYAETLEHMSNIDDFPLF